MADLLTEQGLGREVPVSSKDLSAICLLLCISGLTYLSVVSGLFDTGRVMPRTAVSRIHVWGKLSWVMFRGEAKPSSCLNGNIDGVCKNHQPLLPPLG